MKINLKISIVVINAIILSFLLLIIFLIIFPNPTSVLEKKFYSQTFDLKNKIFIIGSSHTGNLNATLINEEVTKNHEDHVIYNLSYNSDTPSKRQKTLNEIIKLKPKIVFYGISHIEFKSIDYVKSDFGKAQQFYIQNLLLEKIGFDFTNPQFITLKIIRELRKYVGLYEKENNLLLPYTPFFEYHENQLIIKNKQEIQNEFSKSVKEFEIAHLTENQELIKLNEIISDLQQQQIKIIVFTTPYERSYLNSISENQHKKFEDIISSIKNLGVTVYRLDEKYSDLPVWYNVDHIAYNKNSMIYSEDMAKIINEEIEK